jgi:ribosomal protein L11 methyltransferase
MGYYEFKIALPYESRDAFTQLITVGGCSGVIENNGYITAYFPDFLGINSILSMIASSREKIKDSGLNSEITHDYVFLGERDWNETWKKKFEPINVGKNITILPPWEKADNERINLIIDPGMAFGTGHHETTKTCLALIEKFSEELPQKERFLDFGTGTGVLAIAALKLGFKNAVCLDIDPLAVDAARRNAELNEIENIEVIEGSIERVEGTFDFIAANLLSEILIQNAAIIAQHLDTGGIAMLSGMIVSQETDVIKAIESNGLRLKDTIIDGRWVTVLVTH